MDQKEVQMMAAEFVLGTLNRGMLLQFKDELTQNPALRQAVKDWEQRFGVERVAVTPPTKVGESLHQAHRRALGHTVTTPRTPQDPIGTEHRKSEQSKTVAPREIRRSPAPAPETTVIPGAREIPVSFDSPTTSGSKLQGAEAVLDVQAALDQITLDNSLANRARCGLNSRRLPSRSGTAKRALPVERTSDAGNATLTAVASKAETRTSQAVPNSLEEPAEKAFETPQSAPDQARPDTPPKDQSPPIPDLATPELATPEPATPEPATPELPDPSPQDTSPQDAQKLSKEQAARKAETVLKAAQNLLTRERAAKDPETPRRDSSARELPSPLRAEDGDWDALAPRIYKKLLSRDDKANRQSYLLRMIPGGRLLPQNSGGIEELYILEGRISLGDRRLGPGDFQALPGEAPHPEITAAGDSLILVRGLIADRIPDPEASA